MTAHQSLGWPLSAALPVSAMLHAAALVALLATGVRVVTPSAPLGAIEVVFSAPGARSPSEPDAAQPPASGPANGLPEAVPPAAPPTTSADAAAAPVLPARIVPSHSPFRTVRTPPPPHAAEPGRHAEATSQAASVSSAPPLPAAPAQAEAAEPNWRSAVGAWLAAHKRYPEAARLHGDQGVVSVSFTADRDGRVLDVTITQSSGVPLLDQSVHDMLAGQRVPPFPPGMTQAQATLPVAIRYMLDK